ncbi:MAG: zinc dependent phospholipase C family protein [Bacilli bacterium]|nr:zinc dependent phospholipase C family protein [Bacilli bacterium]
MPAILTHYTFAQEAIPECDKEYRDIVNLGTQGPDTFMAYGSTPWIKREEPVRVRTFGHTMHRVDITETYLKMMEYASKQEDKDMLFAYINGILMHYCLDRIMHGYIFYRTGVDETGQLTGYYNWSHGFFEAVLDKIFAKKKGTYQKLSKCIKCHDEEQVKSISKMWHYASPVASKEEDFYISYIDFVGAENLLWTPHGLKRPLFRLLGKYKVAFTQAHPYHMGKFEKLDVLNERHTEWKNPATGVVHNDSVEEMYKQALEDFRKAHSLLMRFRDGEDIKDEFNSFVDNRDHEGGPVGMKKQYYDLCWKVMNKKRYLPKEK